MKDMEELDPVKLTSDLPDAGLHKGDIGTILVVFHKPNLAYEIEFADAWGRTTAQLALLPDQIEKASETDLARYDEQKSAEREDRLTLGVSPIRR